LGPAPLQAAPAPEETFEGTESMASNANARQQATASEAMLEQLASQLAAAGNDSSDGAATLAASGGGTSSGMAGAADVGTSAANQTRNC